MQSGHSYAHFSVIDKIGAGGMGEVYRAHDTKLGRDVALKVLPTEFSDDPERLARFEREARTLAALQHPNVASIYGLETVDDRTFLVMELVEGTDLSKRIEQGGLPLSEVLTVSAQIASGLEAAHTRGIVHRDLKPANIMFNPEGQIKILDFGLARAYAGETGQVKDISHSPTMTAGMTGAGIILGTAAYMSPEQARGLEVDGKSDIWAFGCLVFELLTGVRAFAGDTVSDIVASVLKSEPAWDLLPPDTPRPLQRVLRRCLEKEPRRRLHDVADARIEIEDLIAGKDPLPDIVSTPAADLGKTRARWILPVGIVVALAIGLIGGRGTVRQEPPTPSPVYRLGFEADEFVPRTFPNIAHDGSAFVYPAKAENAVWQLVVRQLDQFGVTPLEGTEYATNPFFSPDGQWIAFELDNNIRKVPVGGGPIQNICAARGVVTGHWGRDGYIYLAGAFEETESVPALARIPEDGGPREILLKADQTGETFYDPWPTPDGKTILFSNTLIGDRIEVLDLTTGSRKVVLEGGTVPVLTGDGALIYYDNRTDRILTIDYDQVSSETSGSPRVLLEGVTDYAYAPTGMIVYAPIAIRSEDIIVSVDREGNWTPLHDDPGTWAQPRYSPDGKSVLIRKTASPNCYLWRYDLGREVLTRVTFELDSHDPAWSPDGKTLAFNATGEKARSIFLMPVDGSRPASVLFDSDFPLSFPAWDPDSKHLVYTENSSQTAEDLWTVAVDQTDPTPEPFLVTPFKEDHARFSPDGRWISYTSDESGREEVYLRPFPGPGGKIQVSREGGTGAIWSPVGGELFYSAGDRLMVVDIAPGNPLQVGIPRLMLEGEYAFERETNYDVAPDGQSFVFVRSAREDKGRRSFNVITNALETFSP